MSKARDGIGVVAGVMLLLSAGAHSLLGGPEIARQLAAAAAPADLARGIGIAWQWGGACMTGFGVIVLRVFADRLRGAAASTFPAFVTGLVYVAFGLWALLAVEPNPFYFVFLVPGLLLLVAASGR